MENLIVFRGLPQACWKLTSNLQLDTGHPQLMQRASDSFVFSERRVAFDLQVFLPFHPRCMALLELGPGRSMPLSLSLAAPCPDPAPVPAVRMCGPSAVTLHSLQWGVGMPD